MVGKRANNAVQRTVPLQIAGVSRGYDEVVVRGSMQQRSFSVLYLKEHRVIATDTVNCPADFGGAKNLIASGHAVDIARLADTSVPLAAPA